MKGYCQYIVIDKSTGFALVCGYKLKEVSHLYLSDSFSVGLFRKSIIDEYIQHKCICGVDCVVVYWVKPAPKDAYITSLVTPYGKCLGLRGYNYDSFMASFPNPYNCRYLLKVLDL